MTSIYDWSATTALTNGAVDAAGGISIAENSTPPQNINNGMRAMMQRTAQFLQDFGAVVTVGGTGDAITVTTSTGFAALQTGQRFTFKAPVTSNTTTGVQLNANAIGNKAVRKIVGGTDVALAVGDIAASAYYEVVYSATANAAAGAWILLNPSSTSAATFLDNVFAVQNSADATKQAALDVSGITTATKRTYIAPDVAGTLGLDGAGITTIASGASVAIGASKTRDVIISGVTTVTAFDTVAAGTVRNVTASGAFLLTHNGTSLILPGGANLTTAAGDCFIAESLGSGNWRITNYMKADGTPIAGAGGQTLLATLTTTSGTTQIATGLATTYNDLKFVLRGVSSNGSGQLQAQFSNDNGATYSATVGIGGSTQVAADAASGTAFLWDYSGSAAAKMGRTEVNSGSSYGDALFSYTTPVGAVNAVKFLWAGGLTFDAGTIQIYGVK